MYVSAAEAPGWWPGSAGRQLPGVTRQQTWYKRPCAMLLCCVKPSRPACPLQVFDTLDALLDPFFFPAREGQPDPRVCPSCSARLVIKPARGQGAFIGCSNYSSEGGSSCGYSRPLLLVDGEQAGGGRRLDSGCCWHAGGGVSVVS